MSVHDAWALACRLFVGGTPVFREVLSAREIAAIKTLGKAVKPTTIDQRFALCPYCQLQRGQIWADGKGGRVCHCPDCGPVTVGLDDVAAFALDEDWFKSKLRMALEINSHDCIDALGAGVWHLGGARRSPVLLARNLMLLWREPAIFDRVRVQGAPIRVISPRPKETRGAPFSAGIEWLALEERFTFYGGGIAYIQPGRNQEQALATDPASLVYGPFSADFRWVTLPEWQHGPIRCTDGQASVFKSLWSFGAEPMSAERIMQRAGLDSDKPNDLFKIKARDKDKPENQGPLFAYRTLVKTHKRQGLYWMPCAASRELSPA